MLLPFQKQSSRPGPYDLGMNEAAPELRKVVAVNLRALMDRRQWSQMELSSKAKVSQRHISNMLSCQTGASFERLNAVAGAFGIPGWLLMVESLPAELLDSPKIPLLVASFRDAGPEGQALVERLAEREAVHNRDKSKVSPFRKTALG